MPAAQNATKTDTAANPTTIPTPDEILVVLNPKAMRGHTASYISFSPVIEAVQSGGGTQKMVGPAITLTAGLNRLTPDKWELIKSSPNPHITTYLKEEVLKPIASLESLLYGAAVDLAKLCDSATIREIASAVKDDDLKARLLEMAEAPEPTVAQQLQTFGE